MSATPGLTIRRFNAGLDRLQPQNGRDLSIRRASDRPTTRRLLLLLQQGCVFQQRFGQLPQDGGVHEVELLVAIRCIKPNDAHTLVRRMRPICGSFQDLTLHVNFSLVIHGAPSDGTLVINRRPEPDLFCRLPLSCFGVEEEEAILRRYRSHGTSLRVPEGLDRPDEIFKERIAWGGRIRK